MRRLFIVFILLKLPLFGDVKGLDGINFDIDSDRNYEARLNETGFGIGTTNPSANLHVIGDVKLSGTLSVGASSTSQSNLNINGTVGYGFITHTSDFSMIYDRVLSNATSDSAEEEVVSTSVSISSSDLEFLDDGGTKQIVGLRFEVPHASMANISDAYIQFESDEANSGSVSVEIRGELNANSPTFTTSNANISSRTRTSAMVNWSDIDDWSVINEQKTAEATPSVLSIVNEIMSLPNWAASNGMSFIFENDSGGSKRVAEPSQKGVESPTLILLKESNYSIHLCDTSSSDLKFELAPAHLMQGKLYTIKKISSNNSLTISSYSTLIDNQDYYVMGPNEQGSISLISNGEAWFIFNKTGSDSTIISSAISSSSDDAEERLSNNSVTITSSDLEMFSENGSNNQKVGLRFTGVNVPAGSTIKSAWVQFGSDRDSGESNNGYPTLLIEVASSMNLGTFTTAASNISGISTLSTNTTWAPTTLWNDGGHAGPDQRTSDIRDLIQALIDQAGWASSSQNIVLIISRDSSDTSVNGKRSASSYNEGDYPPTLFIAY